MKNPLICGILASLFLSVSVHAGDWAKALAPLPPPVPACPDCLSYDFIDLEYVNSNFATPFITNARGFGFGFSKSIACHWYINGNFRWTDSDQNFWTDVAPRENRSFRLGLGRRFNIAKCVDLLIEGGAEHLDAEYSSAPGYPNRDFDSWAYYIGPGLRARSGRFEFYANAFYVGREGDASQAYLAANAGSRVYGEVNDYGWFFTPGVIYHFNDVFGVKIGGEFTSLDSTLVLGGRFHF